MEKALEAPASLLRSRLAPRRQFQERAFQFVEVVREPSLQLRSFTVRGSCSLGPLAFHDKFFMNRSLLFQQRNSGPSLCQQRVTVLMLLQLGKTGHVGDVKHQSQGDMLVNIFTSDESLDNLIC